MEDSGNAEFPKHERKTDYHKEALEEIVRPDHLKLHHEIYAKLKKGELTIDQAEVESEKLMILIGSVDHLTGLDNARAANIKLEGFMNYCLEKDLPLTVIYLDGDGIKRINTESHDLGDIAIKSIAEAVKQETRSIDEPSRLDTEKPYESKDSHDSPVEARRGGDEFEIILPGATLADAETIFNRVLTRLDQISAQVLPGMPLSLTGGAVQYDPNADKSAEELSSRAERAMEFGKQNGKGKFYASAEPINR